MSEYIVIAIIAFIIYGKIHWIFPIIFEKIKLVIRIMCLEKKLRHIEKSGINDSFLEMVVFYKAQIAFIEDDKGASINICPECFDTLIITRNDLNQHLLVCPNKEGCGNNNRLRIDKLDITVEKILIK